MDLYQKWLDSSEEEESSGRRPFSTLPTDAWVLFQPVPVTSGSPCRVELVTYRDKVTGEEKSYYKLKLTLMPVGGDASVDPKARPYGSQFVDVSIDAKESPGQPSSMLVRFRNLFLAPGTPEKSPERKAKALATLVQALREEGIELNEVSVAKEMAEALVIALNRYRPYILGHTYTTRPSTYMKGDEERVRPAKVVAGDWTDASAENIEAHGVVVWDTEGA